MLENLDIDCLRVSEFKHADLVLRRAFSVSSSRWSTLERNLRVDEKAWAAARVGDRLLGLGSGVVMADRCHVGPIAVDPPMQRQGIGGALLNHVLRRGQAIGVDCFSLDAAPSARSLYEEFGFIQTDTVEVMSLGGAARHIVSDCRVDPRVASEIVEYDEQLTGLGRSRLLTHYLDQDGSRAFVARQGIRVDGYCLIQGGVLGPCVAGSRDSFVGVLRRLLDCHDGSKLTVFVPGRNDDAQTALASHGFVHTGQLIHMLRGSSPERERQQIYGQSSTAVG